jgi:tight adherence protein B
VWPHVVDDLASAVQAGLSLPEALGALGERGPEALRPAFARFAADYRATGSFGRCLDRLADELADPVADRLVEALRMTREVGGTDLGRLLRTLSQFLRDDARTRAELEARQSWTVNGARLALAAPWAVLLLLALRGTAVQAYDSPTGVAILAIGGSLSIVAYLLMKRVGWLPEDRRVLRAGLATTPEAGAAR